MALAEYKWKYNKKMKRNASDTLLQDKPALLRVNVSLVFWLNFEALEFRDIWLDC